MDRPTRRKQPHEKNSADYGRHHSRDDNDDNDDDYDEWWCSPPYQLFLCHFIHFVEPDAFPSCSFVEKCIVMNVVEWIKSSQGLYFCSTGKRFTHIVLLFLAPKKSVSINIEMICSFVCPEAWAGPERNCFTPNVLCSCGNRFNQMFIGFCQYEIHICAFKRKLVFWKYAEFKKIKIHFCCASKNLGFVQWLDQLV